MNDHDAIVLLEPETEAKTTFGFIVEVNEMPSILHAEGLRDFIMGLLNEVMDSRADLTGATAKSSVFVDQP